MAAFKVEVKSRELIKPSSPTPNHLKTLQLSFIDQFAPPTYIPLIFFYPNELNHSINHSGLSTLLKKSLSDMLVRFYPLAGRIVDNKSIDCSDQGADYSEATVASDLSKVVEDPNLEDLGGLLPFEITSACERSIVLGVRVNHFSCGGIAISVCVSHKVADGTSATDFVLAWAKTATTMEGVANDNNNDDAIVIVENPKFDLASQFPPRELGGFYKPEVCIAKEKIVTKRLVFDKKKIDTLKKEAGTSCDLIDELQQVKDPTRVEVVSAFIWKQSMQAAQAKSGFASPKVFVATHAVNLRTRMTPPSPSDSFGNNFWFTNTSAVNGAQIKFPELVRKLREAIRKIDNDYIETVRNGECLLDLKKIYEHSAREEVEMCGFSSWCRFPFYEVNFGWGKPIWVCSATLPIKNVVVLLSTRCGEGIEAWVNMLEDDIAIFEHDHELLSLAIPSL